MLKLTGCILIIISGFLCGYLKSQKLKLRADSLSKIISALTILESEIAYSKRDIKTILKAVAKAENLPLFYMAADNIQKYGAKKSFVEAMSKNDMCLLGTDNETLEIFFSSLGKCDIITQQKQICHTREILKVAEKSAYTEYEKFGKLYRNAGLLCGILTVIILF